MRLPHICAISLVLCALGLHSQETPNLKKVKQRADELYELREFQAAIPYYLQLTEGEPIETGHKLRLGACYLHKMDEVDKAVPLLSDVLDIDPAAPGISFYLGKAYYLTGNFEKAIDYFAQYLPDIPVEDTLERLVIDQYLLHCEAAQQLQANPVFGSITPMVGINTEAAEYAPVVINDSLIYFTYKGPNSVGGQVPFFPAKKDEAPGPGKAYEDVFSSVKQADGSWAAATSISEEINERKNDASVAISPDGSQLLIFKSELSDEGDIYVCTKQGEYWSPPEKMAGPINSQSWEGSACFSSDGNTIYFSSERKGGIGGKDIYTVTKDINGEWAIVRNLGPMVNTPFDEDAPYIHHTGDLLMFSSKGHGGMGNYDVYMSELENNSWSQPKNLGYPVNGPGDDLYYSLNKDKSIGYYSSTRTDGNGLPDIYTVEPGIPLANPPTITVNGTVYFNKEPVLSAIKVSTEDVEIGDYQSAPLTGQYFLQLKVGKDYDAVFTIPECDSCGEQVHPIEGASVFSDTEIAMDIFFEYTPPPPSVDTTPAVQDTSVAVKIDVNEKVRTGKATDYLGEDGKEPPPGYYVIIGSFKGKKNADNLKQRMIDDFNNHGCFIMLYKEKGFYRVSYAYSEQPTKALIATLKEMRIKVVKDAWLLNLQ